MHRTYSMRQSRAPTASQIQNPPPPSSTTKSGRFFGKAGLGELCFCSFFSPFLRSLWQKRAHRFPLLAVYNPSSVNCSNTGALRHTCFIQNILTPFLHSSLRCYDLKPCQSRGWIICNFPSPWLGSVPELSLAGCDVYHSSEVIELDQLSR